ncbi:MAG: M28 family peptidase [Bacteroidales bacterium]|nr:M28 family peptidase [Bacteroidales bacterium]
MTRNISGLTLILIFFIIISLLYSCTSSDEKTKQIKKEEIAIKIPFFNADSAYYFVKKQTDFGARVPGSKAHAECAAWLKNELLDCTPHVIVQDFKTRVYSGDVYNGKNIIASFYPEKKARIMLCAHWDSRPFADHDPDPAKRKEPVMGANDGASGVGVLLELARILKNNSPFAGIDIIFFDLEDYGPPQDSQNEGANEHWGLGSQYWSGNPHVSDYKARFVILLDMVGAKDAKFRKEGFSMYYAPDKVKKVWDIAAGLGYQDYFLNETGGYINDDHYFINEIRKVPAIDIIHLDQNSSNGSFFEYWHTTGDTFDKIDKETLQVVGDVVTKVVFAEK